MERAEFVKRLLIALLLLALCWAAVLLSRLLLLLFGAMLVAVILRAAADLLRRTGLPERLAVLLSMLLIVGIGGGALWFGSMYLADDMRGLTDRLPDAWSRLKEWVSERPFGDDLIAAIEDSAPDGSGLLAGAAAALRGASTAVADLLLVVFGGLYLAMRPRLYRGGFEQLLPGSAGRRAEHLFQVESIALRLWLKGQLISMAIVGVLTTAALWMIGLPSAVALGVIAGLAEFVPFVGPVAAAIPALMIAFTVDPTMALWTLLVYVGVQQIESNVVMPVVEHRTVSIPPVLTLFAVVAAAILFGPIGVLLGTPLAVAVFVAVKQLWVHDTLGRPAGLPGVDSS